MDRIASAFSSAATDPTQWEDTLALLSKETGSRGSCILPARGRLPLFPLSNSIEDFIGRYVSEGWILRDDRYKIVPTLIRTGVGTDLDVIGFDDIPKSEYYQELLAPHGLRWFACVAIQAGPDLWGASIQRTIEQGPFQPSEVQKLARLSRDLSAAGTMARALGFARAEGALNAFDVSDIAALMLDSQGQVLKINREAHSLLDSDLTISNRRLRAARSRSATDALDRAVHNVLTRVDMPSAPAVPLPREMGRAVIAHVMRADSIAREVLSPARAFMLLVDPDKTSLPALDDLKNVFGLTRSEARLVIELQDGRTLMEASLRLVTSYETARSTLKQIFRKTDTSSQSDLVRLISRLRSRDNPPNGR